MRRLVMVLQIALLAASVNAQNTATPDTPWSSLEITLPSRQLSGTNQYNYSGIEPGGKTANITGTVTLATEVTPDAVILRDRHQITFQGKKLSLEIVHTCRKDRFLSPTRVESKGEGDDELGSFVATVADGKAIVRKDNGQETTLELPEGTITMAALMRLVTLVPRTPGSAFSYKYSLESGELNLKKDYRLIVLQPETITCAGRPVKCSKYQLSGGGIRPVYYWVNEKSLPTRIASDLTVMQYDASNGAVWPNCPTTEFDYTKL